VKTVNNAQNEEEEEEEEKKLNLQPSAICHLPNSVRQHKANFDSGLALNN